MSPIYPTSNNSPVPFFKTGEYPGLRLLSFLCNLTLAGKWGKSSFLRQSKMIIVDMQERKRTYPKQHEAAHTDSRVIIGEGRSISSRNAGSATFTFTASE